MKPEPRSIAERSHSERGSALIVVMLVIMMLMLLAVTVSGISTTRSHTSIETSQLVPAQALAEIGVGVMLNQIETTNGATFDQLDMTTPEGTVTVTAADVGQNLVRVESTGTTRNGVQIRVEAHLLAATHPAFNKAIYVGNKHGHNGDLVLGPQGSNANPDGSETPDPNWDSNHSETADYVEGDIWINGKIDILEDSTVWGDIDTTESGGSAVDGDVVTGTISKNVDVVLPPDLASMDYVNRPETTVLDDPTNIPAELSDVFYQSKGAASNFYAGPIDEDNDGVGDAQGIYQRNMFHFGQHNGSARINLTSADNGRIFYIRGNLWIHSDSARTLSLPDNEDVQVTIVVEGNLYISDDLNYGDDGGVLTNSGILFIAKGKDDGTAAEAESFTDENKNYKYDGPNAGLDGIPGNGDDFPGEPLINDNGDNIYQGPAEGQGNVYFGDGTYGTGGVTHGFMYAQNNGYLSESEDNSHINSDYEKIYGVYGFLSAGGILDLGSRTSGEFFRNYKVKYNPGIQDGSLNLPGLPQNQGGGYAGLEVVGWRIVSANN